MSRNFAFLERVEKEFGNQRNFAFKAAIPESTLSQIIRGYLRPSKFNIQEFSRLLKCQPEDLGFSIREEK